MKTDIYESDPFSPRKAALLVSIESDYRFEKGDEVTVDAGGRSVKIRIMDVRVKVTSTGISREVLGLKL